jgi:hypothetical protein
MLGGLKIKMKLKEHATNKKLSIINMDRAILFPKNITGHLKLK